MSENALPLCYEMQRTEEVAEPYRFQPINPGHIPYSPSFPTSQQGSSLYQNYNMMEWNNSSVFPPYYLQQASPTNCPLNQPVPFLPMDPLPPQFLPISSDLKEEKENANGLIKGGIAKKNDKKKRNIFTNAQIKAMNALYSQTPNVLQPERETLGNVIGLTQEQIKIWLQNRRYKSKKMNPASGDSKKKEYDADKAIASVQNAINVFNSANLEFSLY